ncbi:hypothetical protein [Streptomyces sp. NPDC096033]|uniref:hypothetical protein n=1 Tax=Streptomyces sp. NPDC096033 TaxID=3366071 RepID=UPI00381120EC
MTSHASVMRAAWEVFKVGSAGEAALPLHVLLRAWRPLWKASALRPGGRRTRRCGRCTGVYGLRGLHPELGQPVLLLLVEPAEVAALGGQPPADVLAGEWARWWRRMGVSQGARTVPAHSARWW